MTNTQPTQPAVSAAVASEFRAEMGRQRISRIALADRTGLTRSSLSQKLNGEVAFSLDEFVTVADSLHIAPTTLLAAATDGSAVA